MASPWVIFFIICSPYIFSLKGFSTWGRRMNYTGLQVFIIFLLLFLFGPLNFNCLCIFLFGNNNGTYNVWGVRHDLERWKIPQHLDYRFLFASSFSGGALFNYPAFGAICFALLFFFSLFCREASLWWSFNILF